MKLRTLFVAGAVLALAALVRPQAGDEKFSPHVNAKGEMTLPADFRRTFSHLGTYVIPDEKSESFGFHDVYTQPDVVAHYRKTGEWQDGAVIVKELRKMTTTKLTTGKSSYATDLIGWFVMVRDARGRFKDDPHWAEGWGWGLYMKDEPKKNVSKGFRKSCMGCHIPARLDDWVFIEGYPTLQK